jgi:hypothetical protein
VAFVSADQGFRNVEIDTVFKNVQQEVVGFLSEIFCVMIDAVPTLACIPSFPQD